MVRMWCKLFLDYLFTVSELHKLWCAILGLNQSRLAKRRGRFRLICFCGRGRTIRAADYISTIGPNLGAMPAYDVALFGL
jgi:hypothetical protein